MDVQRQPIGPNRQALHEGIGHTIGVVFVLSEQGVPVAPEAFEQHRANPPRGHSPQAVWENWLSTSGGERRLKRRTRSPRDDPHRAWDGQPSQEFHKRVGCARCLIETVDDRPEHRRTLPLSRAELRDSLQPFENVVFQRSTHNRGLGRPRPIATIVAGELVAGTLIWKGMQRVSDSAQTAAQTGVQPHRQAMQGYGMQLLGVTMGFSLPPIVISRQRGD